MTDLPETRASLLVRIRDAADRAAWEEFVELYGPLVYRLARRRGLQDADAADVTQTVFQELAGSVQRLDYDPRRGSFRGWLFIVVRNQLTKFFGRLNKLPRGSGDTEVQDYLENQAAPGDTEEAWWEQQYRQRLFAHASGRVRCHFAADTWQAFWQTTVEGKAAPDVARELRMSVGAVYTAKSRVLDRIRKEIEALQEEIDGSI